MTVSTPKYGHYDGDAETAPLLQPSTALQSPILPGRRLSIVFPALALVHFTSFLDQTAITTSLPAIASGLNTGPTISWVGASFLTASTSIQLINGRFADIFGRKICLITALLIMGLGNLLSGLSQTPLELYITRALSGFGAGALNALVQITISDITELQNRGYYFGIMGVAVACGNGLGPLIGGALTEGLSWRWTFWFIAPLTLVAVIYLWAVLPAATALEDIWKKLGMVDWLGVFTSMVAIVLILIPLSKGGLPDVWASLINIAMLISGLLLFGGFVILEFWLVKTPILPRRLTQYGRSTNILLAINIIVGWVFWGNLFYIPLYLQAVKGWSPTYAGTVILALVIAHGVTSSMSGIMISLNDRYVSVISIGTALWATGAVIKATYGKHTKIWLILVAEVFEGIGVGVSFQPVLVGILAGSNTCDHAGITSMRNFLRDMGAAIGTTASGAILNTTFQRGLRHRFSPASISDIISSIISLPQLDLTQEDKELISRVYMESLHRVFISYAVLTVLLFLSTLLVHDYGLGGKTKQSEERNHEHISASGG